MKLPRYPIYIPSKARWQSRLTSKALERAGVPYRICVEAPEYDAYAAVIDPKKILIVPHVNQPDGLVRSRNWIWEHALAEGHARHWQLDDNIRGFVRFHQHNRSTSPEAAEGLWYTEEFADRYANVALAGLQYDMFAPQGRLTRPWSKPLILNTRIYSCTLIDNAIPFRYRGTYNDDTDLSLRVLKAGYCTALVCAFFCKKMRTMHVPGGNTPIYVQDGTGFDGRLEMAKSLVRQHPDVTRITWKWGRWQHHVDYRPFKHNRLRLRQPVAATG